MKHSKVALSAMILAGALCLGTSSSKAQELSAEADKAFWCAAAYAHFVNKAAFESPDQQATALADLSRFEAPMNAEAQRLGWQESDARTIALAYGEEVGAQVDDYLMWKDPAALRLSLSDCFPSTGL